MKITTKTTKEQLKTFLGANAQTVKETDKDLFDRLVYADKMLKTDENKVKRTDLVDLAKEVIKVLGDKVVESKESVETPVETPTETPETPVEPKAENSVKKLKNHKKVEEKTSEEPKAESKAEEPKTEQKAEEKVDTKKSAKKSLGKKKETTKDSDADSNNGTAQKEKELFPKTFEFEGVEYRLAPEIKTMDDLYDALEKEENVLFAFYWTKKHLKQTPYFDHILGKPQSFPNDLDLASPIFMSAKRSIAYHVSVYTDGCYNTLPEDFEEVDGIRYAGLVEFQIYKAV